MADRFIDPDSGVRFGRLAESIVAAILFPVIAFWVGLVDMLGSGLVMIIDGLAGFIDSWISRLFEFPQTALGRAGSNTVEWINIIGGPIGFVLAVGVIVLTAFILLGDWS